MDKQASPITRRRFLALSFTGVGLATAALASSSLPAPLPALAVPAVAPAGRPVLPQASGDKNTLVVAWASGPNGVDHDFNTSLRSIDCYRNVGQSPLMHLPRPAGEVNWESDFTQLDPMAAESWTVSPDWTRVTLQLRQGVKGATGNLFTADDVIWTMKRHSEVKGPVWSFLTSALRISTPDAVVKEGDYTVTINSEKPNAIADVIQAHAAMTIFDSKEYQKHATDDDPWATKWATTHFAGFGPWQLTDYQPGQSWTLERNPNFYDPSVYTGNITRVINRVVPSGPDRLALLAAGAVDIALDFEARELLQLQKTPGVRVDRWQGNHLQWLGFTFNRDDTAPFLKDLNVRLAIGYALPFDDLLQRPYLGLASQMKSTVAPTYPGYDKTSTVWNRTQDMARAKEYMAQSAYPNGFKVSLHYDIGMPGQEESAIIIKSALADLGIEVELAKVQTGDFFNLAFGGQGFPGLFIYRDMAGTPDVNFGSHLWLRDNHCCAPGKYENAEVNRLFDEAMSSPGNLEKRIELQRQIDDIVFNKDPMGVPMQQLGFYAAFRENVSGLWWQSLNEVLFHRVTKA